MANQPSIKRDASVRLLFTIVACAKRNWMQTLLHIALTAIWILPVIAAPAWGRIAYAAASFTFLQQMIWMIEGRLTFMEGGIVHELEAGDCLALGPASDCEFHNQTDTDCRYVVVILKS